VTTGLGIDCLFEFVCSVISLREVMVTTPAPRVLGCDHVLRKDETLVAPPSRVLESHGCYVMSVHM